MSLKLSGRRHGPHATCDPSAPKPKSSGKLRIHLFNACDGPRSLGVSAGAGVEMVLELAWLLHLVRPLPSQLA